MNGSRQSDAEAANRAIARPGRIIGIAGVLLGVFAIATPFLPGRIAFLLLGLLILVYGLLQNVAGFSLRDPAAAGSWFSRGGASILTGLLLIGSPRLTFAGLAILLGLSWVVSGVSTVISSVRRRDKGDWIWHTVDGFVSVALGAAIAIQWPIGGIVSLGLYVGLQCMSAGWSILVGRPPSPPTTAHNMADLHPDERLGLPAHPYLGRLREQLASEEVVRSRCDRAWCWLFLLTFFVIHAARMDVDWTLVGLLSPVGAVVGDALVAILVAYGLAAPISVAWRSLTRRAEHRAWTWYLARVDRGEATGLLAGIVRRHLTGRMRAAVRRLQARGSATAAIGWGLRTGLPVAALLIAVAPLWGVSWFFDTESWVTGAWEKWADHRTDAWRVAMVAAVRGEYSVSADDPEFLRIVPDGLEGAKDFSFVVIGDTGEGDASQHILRDQLLLVGQKPEVKFLVLSSDVIYPSGAMKDYEPKFYLPFKGFHKPILAVPGNHDWYDALEAFTANFFEPKAARSALRARREVDHGLTTTTESRIDGMIAAASRLRREYQAQVALQRSTYFEILTDDFSLVVVDTGILRCVDDDQLRWLDAALNRAGKRFKMAILGHPLYVANRYQGEDDPDFAKIHDILKKHSVRVVMAGDTHDFEYYKVDDAREDKGQSMYHFVNGGGGAYLSIGTALDWPKQPLVPECGCYPRGDELASAMDSKMPIWKRPLWLWVQHLSAWPSTVETLSGAFDYNRAPFFQSFMEVRVESSTNTVRFWLYGVNGRLRWRDLYLQDGRVPNGHATDDFVEFSFPLRGESR
jgi:uncharacterized membrane protein HdeD (DUF308 family)